MTQNNQYVTPIVGAYRVTSPSTKLVSNGDSRKFLVRPLPGVAPEKWRPHFGIDYAPAPGNPNPQIRSVTDGIVVYSGAREPRPGNPKDVNLGNTVQILGADGVLTTYAHLDTSGIKSGDIVRAGQVIGVMGNSGAGSLVRLQTHNQ